MHYSFAKVTFAFDYNIIHPRTPFKLIIRMMSLGHAPVLAPHPPPSWPPDLSIASWQNKKKHSNRQKSTVSDDYSDICSPLQQSSASRRTDSIHKLTELLMTNDKQFAVVGRYLCRSRLLFEHHDLVTWSIITTSIFIGLIYIAPMPRASSEPPLTETEANDATSSVRPFVRSFVRYVNELVCYNDRAACHVYGEWSSYTGR